MRRTPSSLPLPLVLALLVALTPSSGRTAQGRQQPAKEQQEPQPAPRCEEPPAPTRVRLLVMDLKTSEQHASSSRSLTQIVAEEAARVSGYDIVSTEEIRAVLDREAQKQLLGCDESGCLAEIAGALDAELLVSGVLEQSPDGAPVVTLALLNTRALVTVNRVSLTWRGEADRLPEVTVAAAQRLLFDKKDRPPGDITLANVPPRARVIVDDVDRTSDHVSGAIRALDVGPHEVRVLAEGYEPRVDHVLVQSGQVASVDGALEPSPLWSHWWFWTGAGTAVLASVGATVAVLTMTAPSDVALTSEVRPPTLNDVEAVKR